MGKRTVELIEEVGEFHIKLKSDTDGEVNLVIYKGTKGSREMSCRAASLTEVSALGSMLQQMADSLREDVKK